MADHDNDGIDTVAGTPTTGPAQPLCPVCWNPFTPTGRQRYCTDNCRKTAWRRRATSTNPTKTLAPQTDQDGDTSIDTHQRAGAGADAHTTVPAHNAVANAVRPGGAPAGATAPRCPHCRQPVTVLSLLLPPAAAHVTIPRR